METKYDWMIGKKFNSWTVIDEAEGDKNNHRFFLCRCECGRVKRIRAYALVKNTTTKCRSCLSATKKVTHGLSSHPLYRVWCAIRDRCHRKNDNHYHRYGGRGITICDEWNNDFKVFYDWCIENKYMPGLTIDRRNNDGNYEPSNCRFVTNIVNVRNSSICKLTYEQIAMIKKLAREGYTNLQLAEMFNVSKTTISRKKNLKLKDYKF